MDNLTLDDFALFVQIASAHSFSTVARERNVAASHVSRSMARIEAACGLRLAHRTTHSLSLTDEGEMFLEHARRILGEYAQLRDGFGGRSLHIGGTVRISVSQLLAEYVLIPKLHLLGAQYPGLTVELQVEDRVVDMADESIDIAIRAGVDPAQASVARSLGSHGRALYASPGYVQTYGAPISVQDLAAHRLISNASSPSHNQWDFRVNGEPTMLMVKGKVQVNSSAAVISLALGGAGIARMNDVIGQALVDQGKLLPVLPQAVERGSHPIFAVILSTRHRAPKVLATMDYLQTCFASFAKPSGEPGMLLRPDRG